MAQLGDLAHAKTRLRRDNQGENSARFARKRPWPAQGAVSAQGSTAAHGTFPA
jgi:hypothetical protein